MKITRVMPRKLAVAYQEYDIERKKAYYEYYSRRAAGYRQLLDEAYEELARLESQQ